MHVLFVDKRGRCVHLCQQLQAAGSVVFEVTSLDVVERLEPCRIHGVCMVLESGPDALGPIRDLRARAYTGPLIAVGFANATAVLQAGADDIQPLEVHGVELLARLESIRRTSGPFVAGPVTLDPVTRRIWLGKREILDVVRSDVDVLACLVRRAGHPVNVTELARVACGHSEAEPSVAHVAIERLRRLIAVGDVRLVAAGDRAYSLQSDALDGSSHLPRSTPS